MSRINELIKNLFYKKKEPVNIKKGDIFYSKYFKQDCIVLEYVNDDNWTFKLLHSTIPMQAQSKPNTRGIKWYK